MSALHRLIARILRALRAFWRELTFPDPITGFIIKEIFMLPIAPGNSPVFTATTIPAGLTPVTPPTWTSSDTVNAPVTVDVTGLIATVAIPLTATNNTFTLTVSYTNPDGTSATGSGTFTIGSTAPPVQNITGFTVLQTA